MSSICSVCPYRSRRRVPFVGPPDSVFAVVGEAPGYHEIRTGRPFVGESGRILAGLFKLHGIERNEIRIGNVILCGPIKENEKNLPDFSKALECCRLRRNGAGDLAGVEVVLALGASAAWSLLEKPIIMGGRQPRRGGVHYDADKRIVIPSWHPAALLRAGGAEDDPDSGVVQVGQKSKMSDSEVEVLSEDLFRAYELAHGRRKMFKPRVSLTEDPGIFKNWCKRYVKPGLPVAIDVEADSVDPLDCNLWSIGLAVCLSNDPDDVAAISWRFSPDPGAVEYVRKILAEPTIETVYHNLQYDVAALERLIGPVEGPVYDTMLAAHAAFPEVKLDLGSVAQMFLVTPPWKHEFRAWEHRNATSVRDKTPAWWNFLLKYNALDAATTIALRYRLDRACVARDVAHVAVLDVRLAQVARRMTAWGIRLSSELRSLLEEEVALGLVSSERRLLQRILQGVEAATTNGLHDEALLRFLQDVQKRSNRKIRKAVWRKLKKPGKKALAAGADPNPPTLASMQPHGHPEAPPNPPVGGAGKPLLGWPLEVDSAAWKVKIQPPFSEEAWQTAGWNPRAGEQLRHAFDVCGVELPAGALTETGKRSMNKHILVQLVGDPTVSALVDFRKYQRLLSVYFRSKQIRIFDGRLRTAWKIHGTPTGRWSSGSGADRGMGDIGIAVQNWPPLMRAMIEAPEGYVLIKADAAQLELRMIALLSGERRLLDIFNDPNNKRDPHAENAARIYGRSWELYNPDNARTDEEREQFKERRTLQRKFTKTGVYAAMYLAKPRTIQTNLRSQSLKETDRKFASMLRGVDLDTCQRFASAIIEFYPDLDRWRQAQVVRAQIDGEWVCPFSGRRRPWPLGRVEPSQAVNTPVQGSSGSLVNERFLALMDVLPPDVHPILQVHDEVVVECPVELAPQVERQMQQVLGSTLEYMGNTCVFPFETAVGKTWNDKEAKKVRERAQARRDRQEF